MKLKLRSIEIIAIETLISGTEAFPNSHEIVNEWTLLIKPTKDSSPLKVCFDGQKYWLFDGYHRLEAMKTLGFNRCDVIIYRGDRRDALRRYIKDKLRVKGVRSVSKVFKHCLDVLIKDKEWLDLDSKQLANMFSRKPRFFENLRVFASIQDRPWFYFCLSVNKHGTFDFCSRYRGS
jgi:hypothetical protein